LFLPSEVNHETLNLLKYVRPGGGFVPKFPVFGKIEVNGLNEEPLFAYLKVVYLTCPLFAYLKVVYLTCPLFTYLKVVYLTCPLFTYLKVVYLTCPYALLCTALWGQVEYLMDIRPH
jgi:hypothetical protein